MLTSSGGYSADVRLLLVLPDRQLPLGQVGPGHCILREATEFAPTTGEVVIIVDGHETRVNAVFPNGGSATDCRIPYIPQHQVATPQPQVAASI